MKKLALAFSIVLVLLLVFGSTAISAAPANKIKVLIGFDRVPGADEETLVRSFSGDIKYTYRIIPAIAASVTETAIKGLLRNPRVTIIEPDVEIHALDDVDDVYPWGVVQIGSNFAHKDGNIGSGVKVAILDTGIDYTHPDLIDMYAGGWDFVNGDDDPMDDNGHGTHVAGIIAAADNGAGIIGVAPGVEIYALKILDQDGYGYISDAAFALEWATGGSTLPGSILVDITNNSYSCSGYPGLLVELAFWASYNSDGVLNVAAAGNTGNPSGTGDNVGYPARFDTVIAVAATDQSDNRASFSSTGSSVELAAPGVNINSTCAPWIDGSVYDKDGAVNGYAVISGTSMASPHVAGTAALTIAAHPDWSNTQVRQQLQATANDLGDDGKDDLYGYGLVDAYAASQADNLPPVLDPIGDKTVYEGKLLSFTLSALDSDTGDTLTYSISSGSETGMNLNSATRGFTWTPTEAQGPGIYDVTFRVTDDGIPNLYDEETIAITVNEVNIAPDLTDPGDQTINEEEALIFTLSATDSDIPANTLTYSISSGSETGMNLNSATGEFTWTPTESQGPGIYDVTFRVTDDSTPNLYDEETITITVNEVNIAPACFYANQDIAVQNHGVSGSYVDTTTSDNTYEGITERENGGRPSTRHSYLEHKWIIPITGGLQSYEFHVEAYHTNNTDGDDFWFAYSTDDVNYTDMVLVTNTTDDDVEQTYILPDSISGPIYIRVTDADQTSGNRNLDTIYIDHMCIVGSGTPPPNRPPEPPNSPEPVDGAAGVGIDPILSVYAYDPDGDTMDIVFFLNGYEIGVVPDVSSGSRASLSLSDLDYNEIYNWHTTASNGECLTASDTWTFTTRVENQCMYVWDISWASAGKNLKSDVTIRWDSDEDGVAESTDEPVIGGNVYYTLAHEGSSSQDYVETTDANGQISVQWKKAPTGHYVGEVTRIDHDDYTYTSELDSYNPDGYDF